MMTRIFFIRHGETDWNVEKRWQGQVDVPLNSKGHQQAKSTAAALERSPISAVYSSDLTRAKETAGYLAEKFNLPVQTDTRLREIHQGVWQGLKISEIQTNYMFSFEGREKKPLEIAPPGGETVRQVGERIASFLKELVERHPASTVAVVTHGFVIALLQVLLDREPFEKLWEDIPESGAWHEYRVSMVDIGEISRRFTDNLD